jgi:hypothetical protein
MMNRISRIQAVTACKEATAAGGPVTLASDTQIGAGVSS